MSECMRSDEAQDAFRLFMEGHDVEDLCDISGDTSSDTQYLIRYGMRLKQGLKLESVSMSYEGLEAKCWALEHEVIMLRTVRHSQEDKIHMLRENQEKDLEVKITWRETDDDLEYQKKTVMTYRPITVVPRKLK